MRQLASLVLGQLLLRLPCVLLLVLRLLVFAALAAALGPGSLVWLLLVLLPALLLVCQLGIVWLILCIPKFNNTLRWLL